MARLQVITGPDRRRAWTDAQKRAIVAAAFAPGAVVAEVARRADVCPGQIYRWRQEVRAATGGFAEVIVSPGDQGAAGPSPSPAAIEVEVAGTARVRIPASIPAALAAAVVKALRSR